MRLQTEADMRVYPDLTHKLLLELVEYDPETGAWMSRPRPLPGYVHKKPYRKNGERGVYLHRMIHVNGKQYRSARLAYFYMTGKWPAPFLEVDHKNNDPLDDSWSNLRLASRQQQSANSRRASKYGYKGVAYHKASGRYRAHITIDGKQKSLGYYDTPEEAYAAYCKAAAKQWGEFANVIPMPKDDLK